MEIQETIFSPKHYLTLKKSIRTDQISDKEMYDLAGQKLGSYMKQNNLKPSGPWSVLYFQWDETNKKAEIGIAFPVEELDFVGDPELSIVNLPETKAAITVLKGSYDGLGKTHEMLMQYTTEHKLSTDLPVIAVEEYIVDPIREPNPENWVTNIYYLHS